MNIGMYIGTVLAYQLKRANRPYVSINYFYCVFYVNGKINMFTY